MWQGVIMIADVFDQKGNQIGQVEYSNISKEEQEGKYKKKYEKMNALYQKKLEEEMKREKESIEFELSQCSNDAMRTKTKYQKKIMKELQEDLKKEYQEVIEYSKKITQVCVNPVKIVIDINGKYYHHHLEEIFTAVTYRQTRRKKGHPLREVNMRSKIELRENRKREKERIAKLSKEEREKYAQSEEFNKRWDAPYKDYNNLWTVLYDKKGRNVGNFEEGLDTFWCLNLQLMKNNYYRIWHYPKKKRVVDLRKYNGFENGKAERLMAGNTFYPILFTKTNIKPIKRGL